MSEIATDRMRKVKSILVTQEAPTDVNSPYLKLAEKFNKPIITLIDTPGAYPGLEAEERGQGEAIARNIYENVGQVLSLVRVQLSMLSFENEPEKLSTEGSGELIGEAIRDLRRMCRNFYPETELLEKEGLLQTLRSQLLLLGMQEQQFSFC